MIITPHTHPRRTKDAYVKNYAGFQFLIWGRKKKISFLIGDAFGGQVSG